MIEYHKINTIFKREMTNNSKKLIEGDWSKPEFEYLANNKWVFTEKVDGTNIRVMLNDGNVTFGGRTDNASIPAPLVARLQERFMPQVGRLSEMFEHGICLYGEGYGPKIQKGGGNYRKDQDFVLFDIKAGNWWLQRKDIEIIAGSLGIDVVPVIGSGTLHDAVRMVSNGMESQWGPFEAEGIVARPAVELMSRNGSRVIAKIKCRDFSILNERTRNE